MNRLNCFKNEKGSVGKVIDQNSIHYKHGKMLMNKPKHFGEKRSMKQLKQKNILLGWARSRFEFVLSKALNDTTKII